MIAYNLYTEGMPEECLLYNAFYEITIFEISCLYPTLGNIYLPFEKFYDPTKTVLWMEEHPLIPIVACILYAVFIVVGRSYFSKNSAWSWRKILAAWNLSLSLFSTIGAIRTAPHLIHNLMSYQLRDVMCADPKVLYGGGSTGLWVQLFILSKFPELFDTLFIVIHKKPLIFLHWYHHITVLLYCWHSYVTRSPAGLFFMVMNYTVHAVMYGYYFLMAVKMLPKWFNPIVVTIMQLSQMFVGMGVTILAFHYYSNPVEGKTCHIQKENNVAAFTMYGSYFYLFLQFFLSRYITTKVEGDLMGKRKVF